MQSKPIHQFKSCRHTGICSLSQIHINTSTLPISPLSAMRIMRVMECICFFLPCAHILLFSNCEKCGMSWAVGEMRAYSRSYDKFLDPAHQKHFIMCCAQHLFGLTWTTRWQGVLLILPLQSMHNFSVLWDKKSGREGVIGEFICEWHQHVDLWLARGSKRHGNISPPFSFSKPMSF